MSSMLKMQGGVEGVHFPTAEHVDLGLEQTSGVREGRGVYDEHPGPDQSHLIIYQLICLVPCSGKFTV